jgi:pimeloyl-ACP methyl ester carboxylesterase
MFSNLVFPWSNEDWRRMYHDFARFSRLIIFDKRGTGLSDRPRDLGPLETRMDDIRAVLDAVGVERATLVGMVEGGQTCALFAATYPERTEALVLANTPARAVRADDYDYGMPEDKWREQLRIVRERWGERDYFEEVAQEINPEADEEFLDWFVTCQRFCASPAAALTFYRVYGETDLREMLPTIRVPTLVLYTRVWREQVLDLAQRIQGAQTLEIEGLGFKAYGPLTREVERFLSGTEAEPLPDTVLATVMFTDIVGSTERGSGCRRQGLARPAAGSPRSRAPRARTLSRPGGRHRRRRLLRDLRRPGAGDLLRAGGRRCARGARPRDPGRRTHG